MDSGEPTRNRANRRSIQEAHIHNGYSYAIRGRNQNNSNIIYLKCIKSRHGCAGTAKKCKTKNGWVYKENQAHNKLVCKPNVQLQECKNFRNHLKNIVRTPGKHHLKQMYEQVAEMFPKAAEDVPFSKIERSLRQIMSERRKLFKNNITTIDELYEQLATDESLRKYTFGNNQTYKIDIALLTGKKINHLLFFDTSWINQFENVEIFIDTSFNVLPNLQDRLQSSQFFIIKVRSCEKFIYLLSGIMNDREERSYNEIFSILKKLFPNLKPTSVTCDFEIPLVNSLQKSFEGIKIHGCFFHYAKAIQKNAGKYGIPLQKRNKIMNPAVHIMLKKFIALGLLPEEKIAEGFYYLCDECNDMFENAFDSFITYYNNHWLPKAAEFCAYQKTHIIKHMMETFNKSLSSYLKRNPSINNFYEEILRHQSRARTIQISINGTNVVKKPKPVFEQETLLNRQWQLLDEDKITTMQFLQRISSTCIQDIDIDVSDIYKK